MKTERLTLEKLSSCKAAPIPTIPESALQVHNVTELNRSVSVYNFCKQNTVIHLPSGHWRFHHHLLEKDGHYGLFSIRGFE